jgi:hypothetical protein
LFCAIEDLGIAAKLEDHMTEVIPGSGMSSDANYYNWQFLYRTAAISALISVALFLFQIVAYLVWPPPSTVIGHLTLLQSRPLVGLVSLDFVIIVDEVLAIPICLALYLSLHRLHESLTLLATALSAASIVCFLIATPALNMLYLSRQYAIATTSADREALFGAGQAVISSWLGTPYQVGYVLGSIDMILISIVMLRSTIFGRFAAYMGILSGAVGFGAYVPKVGVFISLLSVVVMQIWYVMIALALLRPSKSHQDVRFKAGHQKTGRLDV